MTRNFPPSIFPLGCAALLSLLACNPGESASPSPEATASASPTAAPTATASTPACCQAAYGRWAVVVVYAEKNGACDKVAGPPRVGARPGDVVTWRIYNRCGKEVTVLLTDFIRYEKDPGVVSAENDNYRKEPPPKAGTERIDPFAGDHKKTVKAEGVDDLPLRVKSDAKYGVYAYTTKLSGHPDADQQIEIWP
jgi:hypothetical protein